MKVWMSGEVQADISDAYRNVRNRVEASLNLALNELSYGAGLQEWDFIAIIRNDDSPMEYGEVNRYDSRNKSCEFRLKINHAQFKTGNTQTRTSMLCDGLLRSLSMLESMNVPDLDVSSLRRDFLAIAGGQGWIA